MTCKALTADDARTLIKTNFSRAADILTSNPAGSFLGVTGWGYASASFPTELRKRLESTIGVKQNDSIKPSNELESQAASQGGTGNGSNIHSCTCGIGHHVFGCSDIGRLIVAFACNNSSEVQRFYKYRFT
jgi:hypothetical protein